MINAFDDADYYSCEGLDDEALEETIIEAFWVHLAKNVNPGETEREAIARLAPLMVFAFKRKPVSADWVESTVERLAEVLHDDWMDEFGDPEGDHTPELEQAKAKISEAVLALVENSDVFQCDQVGEREFSLDALLNMVER